MKFIVLLSAPYMVPIAERFRPLFSHYQIELIIPQVNERLEETEILSIAGQFDAAICGDDRFSKRVLEKCVPRLKVLSKWGTGIDSLDRQTAARLGVKIYNTPNAFTLPVADTTLGYILSFARGLPWMDKQMKFGSWEKKPGRALSECVLGVIGVGNVGKAVLRRARAFGMKLLGNDIIDISPDFIIENNVIMVTLFDLLSQSDFVSIHCDLNPTSYHLINKETLSMMKSTAVLINTARGSIIDESALIDALHVPNSKFERRLAGAALDVFEEEPLPKNSPLIQMEHVLLAPHNSNSSPMAWERVHWNTIKNVLNGLGISHDDFDEWRDRI